MKIRFHGMLGTQHSWAFTQQYLIRAMEKIGGHDIFLRSTNGLEHFPDDLRHLLVAGYHGSLTQGPTDYIDEQGNQITIDPKSPLPEVADKNIPYDLELAYTIFYQAPRRFFPQSKARALIWNFESSILPPGWQEYHRALDYILPSSQYSYDIFAANGIPKEKMLVVPHGVDTKLFNPEIPPYELKTEKKIKFLHNAIPHHRKLHEKVLEGYFDAFTGNDDVCLVMKTKFLTPTKDKPFEVDVKTMLEKFFKGRKNPPEVEVINTYIPDIGSLYTACDAVISMSSCEGFWLPGLEALACGSLIIAPRHGGQLDFLNDDNALLVDTEEMKAPISMQYWTNHPEAVVGDPNVKHFSELLRKVYENPMEEKERIKDTAKAVVEKFSWENAAQMILDLPIPERSRRLTTTRKVLYIVPYTMAGGGEVWVKQAIKKLDRTVYEPHIAFINGMTSELEGLFKDENVIIEDLGNRGKQFALKCLVESENYSIIHFYNSFGVYNILRDAWRQGYRNRIIETVHSELSWSDSMMKVAARDKMVALIVSVSNTLAQKMIKLGNKQVAFVQQQVDWDRFRIERHKGVLEELNIPTDFVVGFVGRLSPEKNVPIILQCARGMPDVSFVIIGDGPQAVPLKQMAGSLKNVFFLGRRTDVEKFYAAFDALILPSKMEGMPLVILEAMAAGTPIVASDVGAITEVVKDGVSGFISKDPNDYLLFVTCLAKLKNKDTWQECSNNSKAITGALEAQGNSFNINNIYNMLFKEVK